MLKFGKANAKLANLEKYVGRVYTFSLLSGHTCPYAKNCLSKAIRKDGKTTIQDGPDTIFRCFSASEESIYPNVYDNRFHNLDQITACNDDTRKIANLIGESIPSKAKCIRIHVGGDFFNQNYFNAWLQTAWNFPDILFYAYTKSLPFWIRAKCDGTLADNFVLTASRGGYKDKLIDEYRLREAVVISDELTCKAVIDSGNHDVVPIGKYKGYPIDHDDSHAAIPEFRNQSFALLIHGIQPAKSEASKAKRVLNGVGTYSKEK